MRLLVGLKAKVHNVPYARLSFPGRTVRLISVRISVKSRGYQCPIRVELTVPPLVSALTHGYPCAITRC